MERDNGSVEECVMEKMQNAVVIRLEHCLV